MVKGLAIMSCRFGIDGQCRSLEDIAIEFYGSLFLSLFFASALLHKSVFTACINAKHELRIAIDLSSMV